jgi:hypothetical protein
MAFNPDVTGLVLRTFVAVVSRWLRRRARAMGIRGMLVNKLVGGGSVHFGPMHMEVFCAVLDNGQTKCWGGNDYGQLGSRAIRRADEPGEMGDKLPAIDFGTI